MTTGFTSHSRSRLNGDSFRSFFSSIPPSCSSSTRRPKLQLGELNAAKVAGELNIPYCLSTAGSQPMEEVARVNGSGPRFFQVGLNLARTPFGDLPLRNGC